MSFSDIKLFPVNGNSVIKANGSFVYNGVCQISCTVVSGKNGLFVSLPREKYTDKKTNSEKWTNKVYFTDEGLRNQLNDQIVAAYNKMAGGSSDDSQGSSPEPTTQVKKKSSIPF